MMKNLKNVTRPFLRPLTTQSPPNLDFNDTQSIYSQKSLVDLAKNWVLTTSCRVPLVAKVGPSLMEHDPSGIVKFVTRMSYFKQFCGGETLHATIPTLKEIARQKMRCMLDYSVEGAAGKPLDRVKELRMDKVAQVVFDSIGFSKSQSPIVSFAVVKITGFSDTNLLERISEILCYSMLKPEHANLIPRKLRIEGYNLPRTVAFKVNLENPPKPLADWEMEELDRVMNRLHRIGSECERHGIPLLVDAEQSWYQPAIDQMFMIMSIKHNTKGSLIFNTYQMYLADSLSRLKYDSIFAKNIGIHFGSKLVRGAYIKGESERFHKLGLPVHPINNGIEATHVNYKNGVDYCLDNLDKSGLVIASHNKQTVIDAANGLFSRGLEKNDPRVNFAQLYGMGDYLSLTLANNGYNSSKYLVFGPIESLMPFFARRLTENSDMMGGSVQETDRIFKEINRRVFKK